MQVPDSKVHGANMGPIWDRQDPGGPHVGPMNFVISDVMLFSWQYPSSLSRDPICGSPKGGNTLHTDTAHHLQVRKNI